jgi:hypothetical protein
MKSEDYKQLKKQIEERYTKAIELAAKQRIEALAAIDIVWNMLHVPRQKRTKEVMQQPTVSGTKPLEFVSKPTYGSLIETVMKSLVLLPETFNCKQVISAMQQISGNTFNPSSVSNRLKRMAEEDVIEIIQQGHGKLPSIYRRKNNQVIERETELL